ncbi:hypothetical protein, partial [Bacillus sp. JJ722]|uniref:hypothetical protein n=1 Tax=Bacillus sp. JJ722 TaxID=3122973 RepID=UPI002FFE4BBE
SILCINTDETLSDSRFIPNFQQKKGNIPRKFNRGVLLALDTYITGLSIYFLKKALTSLSNFT